MTKPTQVEANMQIELLNNERERLRTLLFQVAIMQCEASNVIERMKTLLLHEFRIADEQKSSAVDEQNASYSGISLGSKDSPRVIIQSAVDEQNEP